MHAYYVLIHILYWFHYLTCYIYHFVFGDLIYFWFDSIFFNFILFENLKSFWFLIDKMMQMFRCMYLGAARRSPPKKRQVSPPPQNAEKRVVRSPLNKRKRVCILLHFILIAYKTIPLCSDITAITTAATTTTKANFIFNRLQQYRTKEKQKFQFIRFRYAFLSHWLNWPYKSGAN